MRLRFDIKLKDDSNNDIAGIRFQTPAFTGPQAEESFDLFVAKMIGAGTRRRLDILEAIARGDVTVTGIPDIVVP